jgi:hypothetical protein
MKKSLLIFVAIVLNSSFLSGAQVSQGGLVSYLSNKLYNLEKEFGQKNINHVHAGELKKILEYAECIENSDIRTKIKVRVKKLKSILEQMYGNIDNGYDSSSDDDSSLEDEELKIKNETTKTQVEQKNNEFSFDDMFDFDYNDSTAKSCKK